MTSAGRRRNQWRGRLRPSRAPHHLTAPKPVAAHQGHLPTPGAVRPLRQPTLAACRVHVRPSAGAGNDEGRQFLNVAKGEGWLDTPTNCPAVGRSRGEASSTPTSSPSPTSSSRPRPQSKPSGASRHQIVGRRGGACFIGSMKCRATACSGVARHRRGCEAQPSAAQPVESAVSSSCYRGVAKVPMQSNRDEYWFMNVGDRPGQRSTMRTGGPSAAPTVNEAVLVGSRFLVASE